MNDNVCTYNGRRDELLVSYIYDDIPADERAAFDRHLLVCALCRSELDALGGVRTELAQWSPPLLADHVSVQLPSLTPRRKGLATAIRDIPAWAQFAAAMLFVGVAAGLANLEIRYTPEGLSVQTGWRHPSAEAARTASASVPAVSSSDTAPWRGDLTTLERDLRTAIAARPTTVPVDSTSANDEALLRRVRQLIQESERRQQNELALRVAEVETQRQADLVRIDRTLGVMQTRTGMQVMRTQQQVNSLAQRVSQQR